MKVYLDIETFPWIAYGYGRFFEPVIVKELEPMKILSIAWAFDDGPVKCKAFFDFPVKGINDKPLLQFIATEILEKADTAIGHNIDKFDIKTINDRMLAHHLKPYHHLKTYDTLKIAGQIANTPTKKMKHLLERYGHKGKLTHEGMEMFIKAGLGDPKSRRILKEYNKVDVHQNRELFKDYLPWISRKNAVWDKDPCPFCKSTNTQKRGVRMNLKGKFQSLSCRECGRYWQGAKIIQRI